MIYDPNMKLSAVVYVANNECVRAGRPYLKATAIEWLIPKNPETEPYMLIVQPDDDVFRLKVNRQDCLLSAADAVQHVMEMAKQIERAELEKLDTLKILMQHSVKASTAKHALAVAMDGGVP